MSKDPIRSILLEELETVNCALRTCVTEESIDLDDLHHWSDRLARVNKALQSLESSLFMTCQERATLRWLLEYHEGAFDNNDCEAPFDVRAHASLLAKVRSARQG